MAICPGGTLTFGPEWGAALLYRDDVAEPVRIEPDEKAAPDGVDREVASFVGWVLRDEQPIVTAADGRAAVELAEAAYRSIEEGCPVDLPLR
jgi:predicted dehydrogenase